MNQELSIGDTQVVAPGIKNQESATQDPVDECANGNTLDFSTGTDGQAPTSGKPSLAEDALYGLPGDIVKTVDQNTEADPAAVLVTILVMFGNVIGRSAYFKVEERFITRISSLLCQAQAAQAEKGKVSPLQNVYTRRLMNSGSLAV